MSRETPALLDVNLLVALFNPDHIHHDIAHDWFDDCRGHGWATCPITEHGLVRILSNPKFWPGAGRCTDVVGRLTRFCESGQHQFWPDVITLRDPQLFDQRYVSGHRPITDIYLLGLARKMGGVLATFDRTIPFKAVKGATRDSLAVIAAVD